MTQWTPGPWTAAIGDHGRESSEIRAGGSLIANVYGSEDFPCVTDEETDAKPEEFAANARLIAAAPELYDALYDLASATNFIGKNLLDNLDPDVKARILAVLAKARGSA